MFTTKMLALRLDKTVKDIRYYISQGYLLATMKNGEYVVSAEALEDFEENYFYSRKYANMKRTSTLTKESLENLEDFISSVKQNIPLEKLIEKYAKLQMKIPSLEEYLRYQRNNSIREDKKKGMRTKELMEKYSLSEKSIENITNTKRTT